jgi:hypothetical protein
MKLLTKLLRTCFEFLFCTTHITVNSRGEVKVTIENDLTSYYRFVHHESDSLFVPGCRIFTPPTLHTILYVSHHSSSTPLRLIAPTSQAQTLQMAA